MCLFVAFMVSYLHFRMYGLGIHSTGAQSSKIVQQLHQNSMGMSTVNLGFHSRTAHFHIVQKQSNF